MRIIVFITFLMKPAGSRTTFASREYRLSVCLQCIRTRIANFLNGRDGERERERQEMKTVKRARDQEIESEGANAVTRINSLTHFDIFHRLQLSSKIGRYRNCNGYYPFRRPVELSHEYWLSSDWYDLYKYRRYFAIRVGTSIRDWRQLGDMHPTNPGT